MIERMNELINLIPKSHEKSYITVTIRMESGFNRRNSI